MKSTLNRFIDWFEARFSILIDILALLGGAFCIFLAIFAFVMFLTSNVDALDAFGVVMIPGLIGFFGILMLFALRVTRHLTKK
ncbi:MAG TPA: hypothetical protein DCR44_00635 [Acholeplasmatales bacterium]|nr:hypothetical protein [Bacillota bacterium]OHE41778.1 MAG: hypothetical protein A2Y16_03355 [Tenericutes bacterium GWF2_57_13]HAQ55905.1 hypothetical protein [Acholeplasmatales bacterium]